jgi:hypothetical protein
MKRIIVCGLVMVFLLAFISKVALAQSRTVSVNLRMPSISEFQPSKTDNHNYKNMILTIQYKRLGEVLYKKSTGFKLTMASDGYFNQKVSGESIPVDSK